MKIGFLSGAMLLVLYGADCSAYMFEKSSRTVNSRMRPITNKIIKEDTNQSYVIKSKNLWDGRSFADVVKGPKKSDSAKNKPNISKHEKESKIENNSKKILYKLLQPKMNINQDTYATRRAQQIKAGKFSKRYQFSMNRNNKRHHINKLYNAR